MRVAVDLAMLNSFSKIGVVYRKGPIFDEIGCELLTRGSGWRDLSIGQVGKALY